MNPELSFEGVAAPAEQEARVAPVARQARIEDIDVIRGFALFGVLMMNLATAFRIPFFAGPPSMGTGIDHVVGRAEFLLLANKSMSLFSILFGAGLAIFLERASARDPHGAMWLLARRLLLLLAFGLAHIFLLWNGDILVSYALTGLLALLFIRLRPSVLLATSAACILLPSLGVAWPALLALSDTHVAGHYEEALRVYGTGSYLDIVRFRAHEVVHIVWRAYVYFWPHELKNMLVGIVIWRSGILRAPLEHLRTLRWTALVGIVLGSSFAIHRAIIAELYDTPAPPSVGRSLLFWTSLLLFSLGYGAGIILLLHSTRSRKWVAAVAPLGRMAFTNYLTQSIVFSTVFYGYGFGLVGKLGYAITALVGVGFYILQGIFSTIWLRHFRFGPFEWAWRSLTYGQLQPFRLRAVPA